MRQLVQHCTHGVGVRGLTIHRPCGVDPFGYMGLLVHLQHDTNYGGGVHP